MDKGKRYPKEFQLDVVRVVREGEASIVQIAKDFGVSPSSIHDWVKKFDAPTARVESVTKIADSPELQELKKRNRLLEQENEVLRRAAIYLGQANLPKG
jgi:transposase